MGNEIDTAKAEEKAFQNCRRCAHLRDVPGSAHHACNNRKAHVTANARGVANGWFIWPFNFDPTWLRSCDGWSDREEDRKAPTVFNELEQLASLLGRRAL